eukprot:SAG11_NODE_1072_length_5974_cov_1.634553_8_plen_344_part_00
MIIGGIFENHFALAGGAIETRASSLFISACSIDDSCAHPRTTIVRNEAQSQGERTGGGEGGAIRLVGAEAAIANCDFVENTAMTAGGAIFADASAVSVINCGFVHNGRPSSSAATKGGALFVQGGVMTVETCQFADNDSQDREAGDALYIESVDGWLVRDSTFAHSDAYTIWTCGSPAATCAENPCLAGQQCTHDGLSTFCVDCPAFAVSTNLVVQTVSEDGINCAPCPSGYGARADRSGCNPCPVGTYSSGGVCLQCAPGFQPNSARSNCAACDAGSHSPLGSQCVACEPGSAPVGLNQATSCERCEAGMYSEVGTSCEYCSPGRGENPLGNGCVACNAGKR